MVSKEMRTAIEKAIERAESRTSGEIRVHLRRRCSKPAFEEARRLFKALGMHRTKERNAALLFVALESRCFALVGDAGIHERVGGSFWLEARDKMEKLFAAGDAQGAVLAGVHAIGSALERHFPRSRADVNEVPDTVTED